jgi:hypothetical protein
MIENGLPVDDTLRRLKKIFGKPRIFGISLILPNDEHS